jgi:3-hydroxyethyl bacteriochlorophyllide a dehydrogenase
VVWETNPPQGGAEGYEVIHPDADERRDYRAIYDVSGDWGAARHADRAARQGRRGRARRLLRPQPLSFAFPPAFMKEARIRVAAEWSPDDLAATRALIEPASCHLDGLITHTARRRRDEGLPTAFGDPACLKMILDWRKAA